MLLDSFYPFIHLKTQILKIFMINVQKIILQEANQTDHPVLLMQFLNQMFPQPSPSLLQIQQSPPLFRFHYCQNLLSSHQEAVPSKIQNHEHLQIPLYPLQSLPESKTLYFPTVNSPLNSAFDPSQPAIYQEEVAQTPNPEKADSQLAAQSERLSPTESKENIV